MADGRKPNALKALEEARKTAMARAEEQSHEEEKRDYSDLSFEDCFIRLLVEMYSSQLKLGFGVMPDGMAVFARLSYPSASSDPRAGRVSFLVSNEHTSLLLKCMDALDATERSNFWKPDRYAAS
jgi:hypothetical protein